VARNDARLEQLAAVQMAATSREVVQAGEEEGSEMDERICSDHENLF
jgi:hypothetical protein